MVIMGVDPGSRVTGFGVISLEGNRVRCLEYGAIRTVSGKQEVPPVHERLDVVFRGLQEVIAKHSPDVVAVEGVFHAVNVKSALTLGHVRGVVLLAVAQAGIPLSEFSPLEVKKAVAGYGRADKGQVQSMVQVLLNLGTLPEPHDASDALALALCQAFSGGETRRKQRRWRSYEVPR